MKTKLLRIICLILVLTTAALPSFLTSYASSSKNDIASNYDYSNPGSYFNKSLTSADILSMAGYTLTDGERRFLDAHGPLTVKYEEVTTQSVNVMVSGGTVTVVAEPYSYTTVQGNTAVWTPVSARLGDTTLTFVNEGGEYTAEFTGVEVTEDSSVNVKYELDLDIVIAEDDINTIINLAFESKDKYTLAENEYLSEKNVFDAYYAEHSAEYDKYKAEFVTYQLNYAQYLKDKTLYDSAYADYTAYIAAKKDYDGDLKAYNEYTVKLSEYNAAVDNNNNYDDNLQKYNDYLNKSNQYLSDIALVTEQVKSLDTALMTKIKAYGLERQLYSALFSGLINQVVSEREAFINYFKISEAIFNDCDTATGIIQNILKEYNSLKTDVDKYRFYCQNYYALRDNIVLLAQSLEALYTVNSMPMVMQSQGKTEKFIIFLSQLILFANYLSDEPIYNHYTCHENGGKKLLDKNTLISYATSGTTKLSQKTPIEILGYEYVIDTGKAAPLEAGYPTQPAEVLKPEMMDIPPKPAEVARPVEPKPVEDPGEPPKEVTAPKKPNGYIEEPEKPAILSDEAYKSLSESASEIFERTPVEESKTLPKLIADVSKRLISDDSVTVSFVDLYGNLIYGVTVEKNTAARYDGKLPERAEDMTATYVFDCWTDGEGNKYDLSNVTGDVILYPKFTASYKSLSERTVLGMPYLSAEDKSFRAGTVPVKELLRRAEEQNMGLILDASDITARISYSTVEELLGLGVEYLKFSVDTSRANQYFCTVTALDEDSEEIGFSNQINVTVPCASEEFAKYSLVTFVNSNNETEESNKSYSGSEISFKAEAGVMYSISIRRSLVLLNQSSKFISITASGSSILPGELVTLSLDAAAELPLAGLNINIYYYDADGVKHTVDGNSFIMPNHDVTLIANARKSVYTVTFVSDGKIISTAEYGYGDVVDIPKNPSKQNDSKYSYSFVGWYSGEEKLGASFAVTESVTVEARFSSELLPEKVYAEGKYSRLLRIGLTCLYIFLGAAAAVVITIVSVKLYKKHKNAPDGGNTGGENGSKSKASMNAQRAAQEAQRAASTAQKAATDVHKAASTAQKAVGTGNKTVNNQANTTERKSSERDSAPEKTQENTTKR